MKEVVDEVIDAVVKGSTEHLFWLETKVSITVLKGKSDLNGGIRPCSRTLNDCPLTLMLAA